MSKQKSKKTKSVKQKKIPKKTPNDNITLLRLLLILGITTIGALVYYFFIRENGSKNNHFINKNNFFAKPNDRIDLNTIKAISQNSRFFSKNSNINNGIENINSYPKDLIKKMILDKIDASSITTLPKNLENREEAIEKLYNIIKNIRNTSEADKNEFDKHLNDPNFKIELTNYYDPSKKNNYVRAMYDMLNDVVIIQLPMNEEEWERLEISLLHELDHRKNTLYNRIVHNKIEATPFYGEEEFQELEESFYKDYDNILINAPLLILLERKQMLPPEQTQQLEQIRELANKYYRPKIHMVMMDIDIFNKNSIPKKLQNNESYIHSIETSYKGRKIDVPIYLKNYEVRGNVAFCYGYSHNDLSDKLQFLIYDHFHIMDTERSYKNYYGNDYHPSKLYEELLAKTAENGKEVNQIFFPNIERYKENREKRYHKVKEQLDSSSIRKLTI